MKTNMLSKPAVSFSNGLWLGVGSLLFHVLFWAEAPGLNLLFFYAFTLAMLHSLYGLRHNQTLVLAAGAGLAVFFVLWHSSGVAMFVSVAALIALLGAAQAPQIRTLGYAGGMALESLSLGWLKAAAQGAKNLQTKKTARLWRLTGLAGAPVGFFILFYLLFRVGNPEFARLSDQYAGLFFDFLFQWFTLLGFWRALYFLFGAALVAGAVYAGVSGEWLKMDSRGNDKIVRLRTRRRPQGGDPKSGEPENVLGLKKEFQTGVLLMVSINLLLFFVNLVDIRMLWFGFQIPEKFNLSQFVHEGTYVLIFSILLSMGVMLYFFRANLNFYSQNRWLKRLSYGWIAQNIVLLISVGLRNYYYIDCHGLAYKRIGVLFFLALVGFGLGSLAYKIWKTRSAYFLVRVNSWAVYGMALALAAVNWDLLIVQHNLNHPNFKNGIDKQFLLSLSDKTLPYLYQRRELFKDETVSEANGYLEYYSEKVSAENFIQNRIGEYRKRRAELSFLSWTLTDSRTLQQLEVVKE